MSEQSDEIQGELMPSWANPIAAKIREVLGASETEPITVYAPPHRSRGDGTEVTYFPLTLEEFEGLRRLPQSRLKELGLRPWDESGLMLFPVEWYPLIPAGFEVTDIFGEREPFVPGQTDDDCRFGVLAYGIVARAAP
ncbi:MAG TPA: hypothetical protein VNL96_06430 [Gemmatimonadaceae bacterium]|nr:hypothetical protein [Gemmatimonadaceae bacterium]